MKSRSIVATFALALLLVLVLAGTASADKPAVYWHKADLWAEPADFWSPGAVALNWTEAATVPYAYTIHLDGPSSYSWLVPGWARGPLLIPVSNLPDGRYKVVIVACDSALSALDRLRGFFVYPLN